MKAVNLLPAKHRPRQATTANRNLSVFLIGCLALLVVAVLVYVMSVNTINESKTQIAEAQAEAQQANARADALGAYGNFAKVKQDRVSTVKKLAEDRVDWERVLREVAHVLPSHVWVTKADAQDGSNAGSGATPADASTSGSAKQITFTGCAWDQDAVARTLVRLRQIDGASDVTLDHSTRPDDGGSSGSGDSACGAHAGQPNLEYQVSVELTPETGKPYVPNKVPTSLGGGQ
jgi:Tfp pilus assembly protein PilN